MSNVFACRENDGVAQFACEVVLEQSRQVKHMAKEADPAIVFG